MKSIENFDGWGFELNAIQYNDNYNLLKFNKTKFESTEIESIRIFVRIELNLIVWFVNKFQFDPILNQINWNSISWNFNCLNLSQL